MPIAGWQLGSQSRRVFTSSLRVPTGSITNTVATVHGTWKLKSGNHELPRRRWMHSSVTIRNQPNPIPQTSDKDGGFQ